MRKRYGTKIAFYYLCTSFFFCREVGLGKKAHHAFYEEVKKEVLKDYRDVIEKNCKAVSQLKPIGYDYKIWTCWWDGVDETTPQKVIDCFESLKRNNPGHELVVITKDNVKDYLDFPDYYYEKVEKGIITITHFTDIIRANLLYKYGGLWADASIYMTRPFPGYFNKSYFFTVRHGFYADYHVCKGLWFDSLLASGKGNPIYGLMKDVFETYWAKEDFLLCYLLIDAVTAIGYENNKQIKEMIDSVPENNSNILFFENH
ncbi:MAG: capsular polysaccharide synthesis protein, partial [Sphaerochaetaceae bacterium]|nr:capsular polysaccharide synthesis protein [Sphaerochaetaceae bacterium]